MDSTNYVSVQIASLTEKNYPTWRLQMKMRLMMDGLFSIVDGTEAPPTSSQQADLRKYNQRRDNALATIVLAIDPSLLYLVGDPDDPAKVWSLLQNTFMKKIWTQKFALKRKLYNTRMSNNDSLQNHLKKLTEIFNALALVGSPMEEEDKVLTVLASLPDKFSAVVNTFETLENVPSFQYVTEKLLNVDSRVSQCDSLSGEEKSLFLKQNKMRCIGCNQYGHFRRNCHKYLNKNKKQMSNNAINKIDTQELAEMYGL